MDKGTGVTEGGFSVLHFSTADIIGGSARSAYRIHSGLRARGHRSRMLVGYRASNDPDVATVSGYRWLQFADRVMDKLGNTFGAQYLWQPTSHRVARHPWLKGTDIFQLYNTHGGYFSQWLLPYLSARAPLVWRLSDQWAMTGHCVYSGNCRRWIDDCGDCPALDAYPPIGYDTAASLFRYKKRLYERSPMTVVAPSSWIEDMARRSPLLSRYPLIRIPNGLDGEIFRPMDRQMARVELALPADAEIILFCAHILDGNLRKGGDLLIRALNQITPNDKRILALVGEGGGSWKNQVPCGVRLLGYQSDVSRLRHCYAAADIIAIPSMLENLPNTLIEALACGRPVVALDSGGMKDGVVHGLTGYLARHGDADDLANGLSVLLNDNEMRERMGQEARTLFEHDFTKQGEIDHFESLYRDLLAMQSNRPM